MDAAGSESERGDAVTELEDMQARLDGDNEAVTVGGAVATSHIDALADVMIKRGLSTGHADSWPELLAELDWQLRDEASAALFTALKEVTAERDRLAGEVKELNENIDENISDLDQLHGQVRHLGSMYAWASLQLCKHGISQSYFVDPELTALREQLAQAHGSVDAYSGAVKELAEVKAEINRIGVEMERVKEMCPAFDYADRECICVAIEAALQNPAAREPKAGEVTG